MNSSEWRPEISKTAYSMGTSAFGIADLCALEKQVPGLLSSLPSSFTRAVVAGVRLQDAIIEDIGSQPTPLYVHNYRQANYQLDRIAFTVAGIIQSKGFSALAVPASQIVKQDPMSGHISHKLLGWAAGIGFIGRHTLLVHPEYGARMRYVSVLTDMPLDTDKPYTGEDCGSCRACVPVCPASAIKEKREDFNLNACSRKLTEFTRLSFIGQHICGVCVKACSSKNRRHPGPAPETGL